MERDEEGVAAWAAFLRSHATVVQRISEEVEAEAGLPLSWYDVLLELNSAPDRRLRMSELGDAVVLSRSRVSRVIDEMEAAGMVRREPDPRDGRSSFAFLTSSGRASFRRTAPAYLRSIQEHFVRHLSRAELRTLKQALVRVETANLLPRRRTGR